MGSVVIFDVFMARIFQRSETLALHRLRQVRQQRGAAWGVHVNQVRAALAFFAPTSVLSMPTALTLAGILLPPEHFIPTSEQHTNVCMLVVRICPLSVVCVWPLSATCTGVPNTTQNHLQGIHS